MSAPRQDPPDHAPHILVVDDDRRLRDLLSRFLGKHGYRVTTAANAAEAWGRRESVLFDAAVLDVMMPGESGFDLMRRIREAGERLPILMLTAKAEPADRVNGLELGADDYLTKPFDERELLLRLGNILKRGGEPRVEDAGAPTLVRFGPFEFRFDRGELRRGSETIRITERERELLVTLGLRGGQEVSREELVGAAPGGGAAAAINERAIDVQMNRLRRKIELDPANPAFLQTVRGVGYRLVIDP